MKLLFSQPITVLLQTLLATSPVIFFPLADDPFRLFRETFFHVVMLGLAIALLYRLIFDGNGIEKIKAYISADRLKKFLLAMFAFSSVAFSITLPFISPTSLQVSSALNYFLGGALFFFFIENIDTASSLKWVKLLLAAVMVNSALAISQYFGFDPFFTSLDPSFHETHRKYIVTGFMDSPNMLSALLASMVPFLLCRMLIAGEGKGILFWGLATAFVLLPIVLTKNLASLIALAVVVICVLIFFSLNSMMNRPVRLYRLAICWLAVFLLFIGGLYTFSKTDADVIKMKKWSIQERATQNAVAWRMFLESPLTGKGPGYFYRHFVEYRRAVWFSSPVEKYPERAAHQTHNDYAQLLAEGGLLTALPVIAFLGAFWFLAFRYAKPALKRKIDSNLDAAAIGSTGGFTVIAINGLVNFPFHIEPLAVTAIFWLSIMFILLQRRATDELAGA